MARIASSLHADRDQRSVVNTEKVKTPNGDYTFEPYQLNRRIIDLDLIEKFRFLRITMLSYLGLTVDALAPSADEGRGTLR